MSEKKKSKKIKWEKPVVKELVLDFDKDVIAKCYTSSNTAPQGSGCDPGHNQGCN